MGCPKCDQIAAEMNRLGTEGCRRESERMIAKIIANHESKGFKVGLIHREAIRTLYFIAIRKEEGTSDIFDATFVKVAELFNKRSQRKKAAN